VVRELVRSAETRSWKAGEVIRSEQSEDDEILLILEGEVRSAILLCNADQQLNFVIDEPGEFLGLYHFIEPGPHPWTMTAETDVRAFVWPSAVWRELAGGDPKLGYHWAAHVARSLYRRTRLMSTYLLDNICWGLP